MTNQQYQILKSLKASEGIFLCWFLIVAFLFFPTKALSRQNVLTGSFSVLQWYDSNIDRTDDNTRSEWTTTLSPALSVSSEGAHDMLAFRYAPEFSLNNRTDKSRVDHLLSLDADKEFKKTNISLSETFIRSEDPVQDEEREILVSDKRGKSRYWTNNVSGQLGYTFAKDSVFSVGYSNYVLENEEQTSDDYVRHASNASASYRFSPWWHSILSYSYTNGNFDQDEDLDINASSFRLNHNYNPTSLVFGTLSYSKTHYRGPTDDYYILSPSVGWDYAMDPKTQITMELGVSFVKRDVESNEENFSYNLALHREFHEKGSFSLAGRGGFDQLQFDGVSDDGLSEFWSINASLDYKLMKDLTSSIHSGYREDKFIERITDEKEKVFNAGLNLTYSFLRWYAFSVLYEYNQLEADNPTDDYEDNRVYLRFTARKDLLQW